MIIIKFYVCFSSAKLDIQNWGAENLTKCVRLDEKNVRIERGGGGAKKPQKSECEIIFGQPQTKNNNNIFNEVNRIIDLTRYIDI